MSAKRILIITTTDLGYNGITSVIMNYYRNIDRNKIQFDFAIGEKIHTSVQNEIEELGGNIYIMPSRKRNTLKYLKELKKLVKEKRYEVAHVHGNSGTMYFDIHALKTAGVKRRIAHSHNSTCNHKIIHKILKATLNKEMTDGIACSKLSGDWLFNDNYTIINNGIDISKYLYSEKIRKEYREKMSLNDKFVIGHIGHFSYQKNHEFLLDIFKEVVKEEPKARLLLLGDGKLRGKIEEKIRKLGLDDKVILLGRRNDAEKLLQVMDVFVFPSRFEGLPVTLIEAQTSGLKCIVSDVVSKECVITENVQFISLEEDQKVWSESILTYNKCYSRDKIKEKVECSNFNIKVEVKKLESMYIKEIING